MDTAVSVELFVEILNRYVYYFDQQNETVGFVCSPTKTCDTDCSIGDDEISERPN